MFMLRRGIEPLWSPGTRGFTDHCLSTRPPQQSKTRLDIQLSNNKGAKLPTEKHFGGGSAPKFSLWLLLRFGSGRTAPAESMHAQAIIGEPLLFRFGVPQAIRAEVHD